MKILWLCGWYPHSENPLAGNFIVRHAASVAKVGGHPIEILHFAPFQVSIGQLILRGLGKPFPGQPRTINHGFSGVNEEVTAVPQLRGWVFKLLNALIYYRVAHQKVKAKMLSMGMPVAKWSLSNGLQHMPETGVLQDTDELHQLDEIQQIPTISNGQNQQNDYGIVHVHAADKIGVVATWFQRVYRYKIVYTEHWAIFNKQVSDRFSRRNPWFQFSFRVLWRHTDVVAAISRTMLDQMEEELGKCKSSVLLPNVVDPALLDVDREELNSTTINFLHISNLESRKNVVPLIQAFLELRESESIAVNKLKLTLQIVGSNLQTFKNHWSQVFAAEFSNNSSHSTLTKSNPHSTAHKLHATANDTNCEAENWNQFGISYYESRPVAELKQFYQSADVLILPSSAENSPCVIVEAQYFGLPVIATKIGGIPEMVDESQGILMSAKASPEKMKKEIIRSMQEFLQKRTEFDKFQIRTAAIKQFHPDYASLDLVKTYASLKFTDQP